MSWRHTMILAATSVLIAAVATTGIRFVMQHLEF